MGEQRPFDEVSLIYILSLVFLVLERGGIASTDAEEADEQIVLSLEFLSFHTDMCKSLSRSSTVSTLAHLRSFKPPTSTPEDVIRSHI